MDALKINYLTGPAFTLVERTETLDEVWKKLIKAYGNVKLLLQNKLSCLDEIENFEKLKGDEKIAQYLAKLINIMIDLSTLAQKHNLECKLYVGGGLEKVLTLLGNNMERKFYSKNLDDDSLSDSDPKESEITQEKRVWEKLVLFLQKELSLRDKMVLVGKSKVSLGLVPKPTQQPPKHGLTSYTAEPVVIPCHICGKDDHVLSTDQNGKKHCDFSPVKLSLIGHVKLGI